MHVNTHGSISKEKNRIAPAVNVDININAVEWKPPEGGQNKDATVLAARWRLRHASYYGVRPPPGGYGKQSVKTSVHVSS